MWQEASPKNIFKDGRLCRDAKVYHGAGEVTQWSTALTALPRGSVFYPRTYMAAHSHV